MGTIHLKQLPFLSLLLAVKKSSAHLHLLGLIALIDSLCLTKRVDQRLNTLAIRLLPFGWLILNQVGFYLSFKFP